MSNNRGPILNTKAIIKAVNNYRIRKAQYAAQREKFGNLVPDQNMPSINTSPNAAALARKVINNKGGVPATPNNKAQLNALIKETQALGEINKAAERVNKSALKVNGNNMRRLFGEN